jgi:cell pole-organizing protein PopZ
MTDRKMSAKGFLHKTTTKAAGSAMAFLATHRDWLLNGEVAIATSPIIAKMDAGEILPTPCLEEVKAAVFNHMIAADALKAEASVEKEQAPKKTKPHVGTIYEETGAIATRINNEGEVEELIKSFDMPQDCQRWCDRRLVEAAPRSYATMDHVKTAQQEVINRDEAHERIFKVKSGPVIKPVSKSTPRLGFGVKSHPSKSTFSHG